MAAMTRKTTTHSSPNDLLDATFCNAHLPDASDGTAQRHAALAAIRHAPAEVPATTSAHWRWRDLYCGLAGETSLGLRAALQAPAAVLRSVNPRDAARCGRRDRRHLPAWHGRPRLARAAAPRGSASRAA